MQSRATRVLTGVNYGIQSTDIYFFLTQVVKPLIIEISLNVKIFNIQFAPNLSNSFIKILESITNVIILKILKLI